MKNHLLGISLANNILLDEPKFDDALQLCITILGESQEVNSCYVFKMETESIQYSYDSETKKTVKLLGTDASCNFFSEIKIMIPENKCFYGYREELKPTLFKTYLATKNTDSFLLTPIYSNNKLWGFIGYENHNRVDWINEEVRSLSILAKNIGIRAFKDALTEVIGTQMENLNYYMTGTNQAMWELDLTTKKTLYSYYWAEMIGYDKETIEHSYDFWRKNVHPDDIEAVEKNLHNYIANISDEYSGIMRMNHKKGHIIWVKYCGILKRDDDGTPLKIIGTHIDVTDIKEKEIQLQLSEEKYRFITENTTDIICQHNLDTSYIYLSNSFKEILGYETDQMINKIASDYVHPDDFKYVMAASNELASSGKHTVITYRFRKKDQTYVWLETTGKNIVNTDNKVIGTQTCSRDVSERIEIDEKREAALIKEKKFNEMKSEFVSMASHQFRTPLTVIYSNTELLDLKLNKNPAIKPITNRIKREVDRMTELMNNILVFAKYESQKLKKEIKPISFDAFVKLLIKTYFNNTPDGRKIKVITKGERKTFYSDESLLIHILTNLINNAFKYSIGKATPCLIINYLENKLEIEVIDYGIGIPEHEVEHLFTSFFRASNTNTIIGSGLGLVIVKQFTRFLSGTIELKTKENDGTIIKLQFPYEQE
ncbi:PAS domain-containing sensor histidine kinase [Flavobacterium frigoris]|uniref:histidine kinase n=1 Tax=Flavobacterium frigoris (strain PS1) TaxID=1086011 RepID=H7FQV5_FLAFP|nr:PAS domain-containing sensor histidine kinase [Flavobacterium frigoris]EIA09092.1 two-component system sensor histidine kinase/response [Flavobacterium frigoris PS1]